MIGIFDSGVGGLTVVNAIKKINPDLSIIYFGDTARVPWGEKSPEIIQEYSKQICEFLLSKKVDKIVIACNTASSVAGDYLRKVFPNIEFIDVVTPTIMEIQNRKLMNVKKIAVIGTKVVVASNFYNKKITEIIGNIDVKSKACSLFVPMVEEGWHKEPFAEEVAEKYLADIRDWSPDVLFLGCTHYPMLIEVIKKVMGVKIEIIDSASPIAACLRGCVDNNRKNLDHFYFSDLSLHYKNLIRIILGKDVKAEQMDL